MIYFIVGILVVWFVFHMAGREFEQKREMERLRLEAEQSKERNRDR